jgi:hypothetical protein
VQTLSVRDVTPHFRQLSQLILLPLMGAFTSGARQKGEKYEFQGAATYSVQPPGA